MISEDFDVFHCVSFLSVVDLLDVFLGKCLGRLSKNNFPAENLDFLERNFKIDGGFLGCKRQRCLGKIKQSSFIRLSHPRTFSSQDVQPQIVAIKALAAPCGKQSCPGKVRPQCWNERALARTKEGV